MSDAIRLAIVGVGFIGNYHARAAVATPGVELVAAASTQESTVEAFAAAYDISLTTTEAESIAERDDIDAVVIGVPNRYHAPLAIKMLKAGKHVLIEKPMAVSAAECRAMMGAAEKSGRHLMTGHMWRFDLEANYLRSVMQSGLLGDVVRTMGYGGHVNWGPSGWFTEQKLAGGGALVDMGVHAIDTVRFLLGDPDPVRVYAQVGTFYGDWDVDDTGVLMITWDSGVVSVIESGWWQPHLDGLEASTQIWGTEGYGRLFPTELKLKIGGFPGTFTPPMPAREDHCEQCIYDRQMAHFADCIINNKPPKPGGHEGLVTMKILDAAYKSAKTGKAVNVRPEA